MDHSVEDDIVVWFTLLAEVLTVNTTWKTPQELHYIFGILYYLSVTEKTTY